MIFLKEDDTDSDNLVNNEKRVSEMPRGMIILW